MLTCVLHHLSEDISLGCIWCQKAKFTIHSLKNNYQNNGGKVYLWYRHAVCVCAVLFNFQTNQRVFTKFGMNIMPLEITPT
jgi:hypothetical protein